MKLIDEATPIGPIEVAVLLDVKRETVRQWGKRGIMPGFDFGSVNGSGAWRLDTILRWAEDTSANDSRARREPVGLEALQAMVTP